MRDAIDHLLDENGLADAGATEETNLSTLHIGGQQVEDLDARLQHLGLGLELLELGRIAVDGPALGDLDARGIDVQHVTGDVPHVALGDVADGHGDRGSGVAHLLAAAETVGRLHRDGADDVVADVQLDLKSDRAGLPRQGDVDVERVEDVGHLVRWELDVHDGADDPGDPADGTRPGRLRIVQCGSHILTPRPG